MTGTENLMMAAALAKGTTVLENSAMEPEVIYTATLLSSMGAKITGAGTSVIEIEGVDELRPFDHTVIPDRIEAGTFMAAAAITGGEVTLTGIEDAPEDAVMLKFMEAGVKLKPTPSGLRVKGPDCLIACDISTRPYPGFPTDMQAQFMALMCIADGTSVISENIFENRFMHVAELQRMGADISLNGHIATVRGVAELTGADVMATDLRASASLVVAALAAKGRSNVHRIYHLDRGYEGMEMKLRSLGAIVTREKESS